MSYGQFKRELFAAVLQCGEALGKHVRLLEREESGGKEELLCIVWTEGTRPGILCWSIGILYERFLREGWKNLLCELAYKLRLCRLLGETDGEGDICRGRAYPKRALWECARDYDKLILRPMNWERGRAELKDNVYWRFGDTALVLYMLLGESREGKNAMKVTRKMLRGRTASDEVLLINALLNCCSCMPPRLYCGTDLADCGDTVRGSFMPWEAETAEPGELRDAVQGVRGYRLTTLGHAYGAVALFYPGVQERLAGLFGGDYYVGFISVHEAVVHPVRHKNLSEMKAALLRANALCDRRDMLSTRVYRYCLGRGRMVEV